MDKKQMRQEMKKKLAELPVATKRNIEERIAASLFSSEWWKSSETVGITISKPYEWDTERIIRKGWEEGKKIVVPKCEPATFMLDFREIHHFSQLECVYHDIWEPVTTETEEIEKNQIDLMIVPGLVFDKRGYRIGYGGGYYDRYLDGFLKETIAVTSSMQIMDTVPIDKYDLAVNHIITENGILF